MTRKRMTKQYIHMLRANMSSLEFRWKNRWNKKLFFKKIINNDLLSEKYKNTCKYLNYAEHLLILASTVTVCVLISAFTAVVAVPVDIMSSAGKIKTFAITAGIKKYKSVIRKKKKHDKTMLLAKSKLDTIEVLIFKGLFDSYINMTNLF